MLFLLLLTTALDAGRVAAAPAEFVPGEIIVKFRPDVAAARRSSALAALGGSIKSTCALTGAVCVHLDGLGVEEAVAKYRDDPAVEYVEPNFIWRADTLPNDPSLNQLWGLHNVGQSGGMVDADIDAAEAWDVQTDAREIVVAVIDSGIDYTHPDLQANCWVNPGEIPGNGVDDDRNGYIDDVHGYDFVMGTSEPYDAYGHGTHCAGTIGAVGNNGVGVVGVCWNVRIMALEFLDGLFGGTTAAGIAAIEYATMMGADIISASWGGPADSAALRDAIAAAGAAGIAFVAAAGNDAVDTDVVPHYPSCYDLDNVVSVAATDRNDSLASFSNWGLQTVDLAAPGVDVFSTVPGGSYLVASGTSMACPHVTGAIALIMARFPGTTGLAASRILLQAVESKPTLAGKVATGGRLNAAAALIAHDAVAPDPIIDLTVTGISGQWVDLAWTATGDDGSVGRASAYELRRASAPIDAANFAAAVPIDGVGLPAAAGTGEHWRVPGLDFSTAYWFAIRALDDHGHASPVVNGVHVVTTGPPAIRCAPDSLAVAIRPGEVAAPPLTIANSGASELNWLAVIQGDAPSRTYRLPAPPASAAEAPGAPGAGIDAGLTAALADLTGKRIIWDVAHGQASSGHASQIIADLRARGAIVMENDRRLDSIRLNDIDVFWSTAAVWPFTAAETAALTQWLSRGGGMLLEGDGHNEIFNNLLAAVGAGITFGGSQGGGVTRDIRPHPTTRGVEALAVSISETLLGEVESPAMLLLGDGYGHPLAAWSRVGIGRVMAFGARLIQYGNMVQYDNRLFGNQVMDWLATASWLRVMPDSGTVPPGSQQDLAVVLDAGLLCGGAFTARLVLQSNDPATPEIAVSAALDILGEPTLGWAPEGLVFPSAYLSLGACDTLQVRNDGCEPLHVSAISVAPQEFTVQPQGPLVLDPEGVVDLVVSYRRTVPGMTVGEVTIMSDDPNLPVATIPLKGTGIIPPVIVSVSPDSLSSTVAVGDALTSRLAIGNDGAAELNWMLAAKPPHVLILCEFDYVGANPFARALAELGHVFTTVATWAELDFELRNRGPWDLVIVDDSPSSFGLSPLSALSDHLNAGRALIFSSIAARLYPTHPLLTSLGVTVHDALPAAGDLVFVDPLRRAFSVPNVVGSCGWTNPPRTGTALLVGARDGATTLARFSGRAEACAIVRGANGRSFFNAFRSDSYIGDGDGDGTPDMVELAANQIAQLGFPRPWLSVEPARGVVPAGATVEAVVRMDASSGITGVFEGALVLNSNDPLRYTLEIPATMMVPGSPALVRHPRTVDLGSFYVGQSVTAAVTIGNDGSEPLTITGLATAGAGLTIAETPPLVIPAWASRELHLGFTAETLGASTVTLTIASDDPREPLADIEVVAIGVEPPVIEVTAREIAVTLAAGEATRRDFTVANAGQDTLKWTVATEPVGTVQLIDRGPGFGPSVGGMQDGSSYTFVVPPPPAAATATRDGEPTLEEVLARFDSDGGRVGQAIPGRYDFTDGVAGQFITDGGNDMYDVGNILSTNHASLVPYSDGTISNEGGVFGPGGRYFTRKREGVFLLAADVDALDFFRINGQLGADGAGAADGFVLEMTLSSGRRLIGFVKRVYGAGDPSVNHLVIVDYLPGASHTYPADSNLDTHTIEGLAGQTRLYYLLYAAATGACIDVNATADIMRAFLSVISGDLGWIRVEPNHGTLLPGATGEVAIHFNADFLAPGDRDAVLALRSNDPARPLVELPVRLRLLAQPGALAVTLSIEGDGSASDPVTLGVVNGATDGYDAAHDLPFAGTPSGAPVVFFPHPDWAGTGDGRFSTDLRSAFDLESFYKTWVVEVETDRAGPLTVTASGIPPLPLATDVLLLDATEGRVHDLAAAPQYVFSMPAAGRRAFTVRAGVGLPARESTGRRLSAGWSLIGVPVTPAPGATLSDVVLVQAPPGSWLYAWNPVAGSYDVLAGETACTPGRGMWYYSGAPCDWSPAGGMVLDEVTVPLSTGWTLVGYPLWFAGKLEGVEVLNGGVRLPFAEAVATGLVAPLAFDFAASGAYESTSALAPWRAYWVASYASDVALCFDHEHMSAVAALPGPGATKNAPVDWRLTIGIEGGGNSVTVGQVQGAQVGFDPGMELPMPPAAPSSDGPVIAIREPAWSPLPGLSFSSDLRAPGDGELVFRARIDGAAGGCRLVWDARSLPVGRDLSLRAAGRTLVASMRAESTVELNLDGTPLTVEFATPPGQCAPPAPAGPDLCNVPNPFNPSTELRFNLPAVGAASVLIYDTRGRQVRRLDTGRLPGGPTILNWDGRDDRGLAAGSGVYLYRLVFEGRQLGATRKMVLVK